MSKNIKNDSTNGDTPKKNKAQAICEVLASAGAIIVVSVAVLVLRSRRA